MYQQYQRNNRRTSVCNTPALLVDWDRICNPNLQPHYAWKQNQNVQSNVEACATCNSIP